MTLQRHLTLVIPGLLPCSKQDVLAYIAFHAKQTPPQTLRLRALEMILSRASRSLSPVRGYDELIADVFAVNRQHDRDLPVGAFSALLHNVANRQEHQKWYLRADPVHLRPDGDGLIVFGNQGLNITRAEADAFCAEINAVYDDMPWRLFALTPTQWLLESDVAPKMRTYALDKVIGLSLRDYLPYGDQAKQWHAILNELQMLMHSSSVNAARLASGETPVNSVWFWGGGSLPESTADRHATSWVQCWSNESLSLALAKFTNVPRADLPADGKQWLSQAITPGRHLMVLEDVNVSAATSDIHSWWQILSDLDERWLSPCVEALKQGELDSLSLVTDHGQFDTNRHRVKRWWTRIRPVAFHIPR